MLCCSCCRCMTAGWGETTEVLMDVSPRRLAPVQHRHLPAHGLLSLSSFLRAFLLNVIKRSQAQSRCPQLVRITGELTRHTAHSHSQLSRHTAHLHSRAAAADEPEDDKPDDDDYKRHMPEVADDGKPPTADGDRSRRRRRQQTRVRSRWSWSSGQRTNPCRNLMALQW